MGREPANPVVELPSGVVLTFSAIVVLHFIAVIIAVLATPSGPWPAMDGMDMAMPPQFSFNLQRNFGAPYLKAIKLNYNYHFASNRPGLRAVTFEVRLKNAQGQPLATLKFPEQDASYWVRHRQGLLASWMRDDQPVMAGQQGEVIAAPNQAVPTVQIWDEVEPQVLKLRTVSQNLIPRDRPVFRPADLSMALAKSYVRHLCKVHGAASGEFIRHSKEPIPPAALFRDDVQAAAFQQMSSNFGEMQR